MADKPIISTKTVNPSLINLAQDVKSTIRKNDQASASMKFALFLGAGASVSSGIPLVSEMIKHFKNVIYERHGVKFSNEKEEKEWLATQQWFQKKESEYSRFFEECYDTETKRRSYIESIIAGVEPSFGYMVLANLINYGYFKTVVTTNFDDLVYIASTTFTQMRPVVYSLGGFATEMTLTTERPRVLKLHGDFLYSSLKNTGEEIKHQDINMKKEVHKVLEEYDGIIVVGYSGCDKSVMDMLKKIPKGKTLYWCYRKGNSPDRLVQNFIQGNGRHLVEIDGFDELMNFLRQFIGVDNKKLAKNFENNLRRVNELLFKFKDDSTISFIDEMARSMKLLSLYAHGDEASKEDNNSEHTKIAFEIIELEPDNYTAHFNLGVIFSKDATKSDEAKQMFRKAIELKPDYVDAYNSLGNLFADKLNKPDEAEQMFKKAIELNPDYVDAYNNLGILFSKDETKSDEAEQMYRKAIELKPDFVDVYNNLGITFSKDETKLDEAEQMYRKTIELKPDYVNAYNNLGLLFGNKLNKPDEAKQMFRKAIELKPDYVDAYNSLGNLFADKLNKPDEAEQMYRKAIELNPSFVNAYFNLGILFTDDLNKPDEAEQMFRKFIELNPNEVSAYNNLGDLFANKLNKPDEAEQMFRKAIELKPDYVDAYNNLGILFADKLNRLDEAEQMFRKTIELVPEETGYYYNLAQLFSEDETRRDEIEQLYRKIIELKPDDADRYYNLGNFIFKDENKSDEAEQMYRKAIELKPDHINAYHYLGVLLSNNKIRLDEAEQMFRKVIELSPDNANAYNNLGIFLGESLNQFVEAEQMFRKAIEIDSNFVNAYSNLGNLLIKTEIGSSEVENTYRKIIELEPENETAYSILANLFREQNKISEALEICELALDNNIKSLLVYLHLASLLKKKGEKKDSVKYSNKAKKLINDNDYYNLACLYSILDKTDKALDNLELAIEKEPQMKEWARRDSDFEWVKNNSRFKKIVSE